MSSRIFFLSNGRASFYIPENIDWMNLHQSLAIILKVSTDDAINTIKIKSYEEACYWINMIIATDEYKTDSKFMTLLQHVFKQLWEISNSYQKYLLLPILFYFFGIIEEIDSSIITNEEIVEMLCKILGVDRIEILNVLNHSKLGFFQQ